MSKRRRITVRKLLLLCLSLLLAVAPAAPAGAAGEAPLQGAVLDSLGRPVAKAELEVYQLGAGLVTVLTADAGGAFRLNRPAQGVFLQLRVSAPGYSVLETGWQDLSRRTYLPLELDRLTGEARVSLYDTEGRPAAGQALLLGPAGELIAEVTGARLRRSLPAGDYRVLAMAPGLAPRSSKLTVAPGRTASAVLTLEPAAAKLAGEVRDARTRQPLAGAWVELLRDDQSRVALGATDARGRFRLSAEPLPGAQYRLQVYKAGYRPATSAPTTLTAGQERLWSGSGAVLLQPFTGALKGTLLGGGGQVLEGVKVALHMKGYGQVAEASTDAAGEFRFTGLAAGADRLYRVTTEAGSDHGQSPWAPVEAGAVSQVVVQARSGAWQSYGAGSLSGVVQTTAGDPVTGARVELLRRHSVVHSLETGPDGSFLVKDLSATTMGWLTGEPYSLRVSKDGFATTREFLAGGNEQVDLAILAGSRNIVTVALSPVARSLQGQVTGVGGKPLAGARVRLVSGDRGEAWNAGTDDDGWYRMERVPTLAAWGYTLEVEAEGYLPQTGLDITGAAATGAALPLVSLTPTWATFAGQVLGPGGQPVEGVTVTVLGPDGATLATAETAAGGTYRLAAPVGRPGFYLLTAGKAGWGRAVAEVGAPAAGSVLARDLVLMPDSGSLEGRILRPDGQPAGGTRVELLEEGVGVVQAVLSGPGGRYAFTAVKPAGSGWFWVRVYGSPSATQAGSLRHGTELVPLQRISPGESLVLDILIR